MKEPVFLEEVDSTNKYLKGRKDLAPFSSVVAFSQTGGKGSKGRSFVSPYGGVYISVYLEPKREVLPLVTPIAAVATMRAIRESFGQKVWIKWVNDLVLDEDGGYKKVCGILTEGYTDDIAHVVVGIGVNAYRAKEGYGAYENIAGYLREDGYDREKLKDFSKRVVRFLSEGLSRPSECMEEYEKNAVLVGKTVLFESADRSGEYLVVGVDEEGRLLLQTENGVVACRDGEVKEWRK